MAIGKGPSFEIDEDAYCRAFMSDNPLVVDDFINIMQISKVDGRYLLERFQEAATEAQARYDTAEGELWAMERKYYDTDAKVSELEKKLTKIKSETKAKEQEQWTKYRALENRCDDAQKESRKMYAKFSKAEAENVELDIQCREAKLKANKTEARMLKMETEILKLIAGSSDVQAAELRAILASHDRSGVE